ncbi:MAG: NAD(+)/NADH kinase [Roseburia sp.]
MKHFFIIANGVKDEALQFTGEMKKYIEQAGGTCDYCINQIDQGVRRVDPDRIPENVEAVFVIGGDGTLIRAARDIVERQLPVIGVNLGKLGYLCELEGNNVYQAIDALLRDEYTIENRMMLGGYTVMQGERSKEQMALNDVVIHRTGALQILHMKVFVNGEYLASYLADGIIVATPTGSTGYSMSAGGPIVDPKANLLLITPINAHNLNAKSIVIDADAEVMIEIDTRRSEKDERAEVSFDGDTGAALRVGDRIVVHRAQMSTRILKLNKIGFLEILRKKMQNYT